MRLFTGRVLHFFILIFTIFVLSVFDGSDALARVCHGGTDCTGSYQGSCEAVAGCTWVVNPDMHNETSFVNTLCNLVTTVTGNGGRAFAALAIIALGVGFYTGKVSWGLILGVGAGIATIFGSFTIVAAISGTDMYNCVRDLSPECDASSPGFHIPDNSSANGTSAHHNASIRIKCDNGYYGQVNNLVCFDGEWFGASGICQRTDCDDPNVSNTLSNGIWEVTQANNGVTVRGNCLPGYSGSPTIKCEHNVYVDVRGSCEELPVCDSSTPGYQVIFGNWSSATAYVGQSVSATCDDIQGAAPSNMECRFDPDNNSLGIWVGGDDENCKVFAKCIGASAFQPLGANGLWPSDDASHEDSLIANCNFGVDVTKPELICDDGIWNSNGAVCPSGCTGAVVFKSLSSGGSWSDEISDHGDVVTGNCPGGYDLSGPPPELSCNNGVWSDNGSNCFSACEDVIAAHPLTLGSWPGNIVSHTDTMTANCPGDYSDDGAPELNCNDGVLSYNNKVCPASCSDSSQLPDISPNGMWSTTVGDHGDVVTGTCQFGNDGPAPKYECIDGTWTELVSGYCPAGCTNAIGSHPLPAGGSSWSAESANHGDSVNATCMTGQPSNPPSLSCNNGVWSLTGSICPAGCNNANAFKISGTNDSPLGTNGSWDKQYVDHGLTVSATCPGGGHGTPRLSCNNGTFIWNNKRCFKGCTGADAFKTLSDGGAWNSQTASHNGEITANCPDGGSPELYCNDGTLTWNNKECYKKCNPNAPDVNTAHQLKFGGTWNKATKSHRGVITASCPSGEFDGANPILTCDGPSGEFVKSGGDCTVLCNAGSSGYITKAGVSWSNGSRATLNNSITASCAPGYKIDGNLGPLICQSDGSWSGDTSGTCKPATCPGHNFEFNSRQKMSIGTKSYGTGCLKYYSYGRQALTRYNYCCPDGKWAVGRKDAYKSNIASSNFKNNNYSFYTTPTRCSDLSGQDCAGN